MKKFLYLLLLFCNFWRCDPIPAQMDLNLAPDLKHQILLNDGLMLLPDNSTGGITIPTDSLRIAINFTPQFGFPANTFAATVPDLYTPTNAKGDTLTLNNCTDSTAFGYVYLNGTSSNLVSPARFYIDSSWTLVLKETGFANGIYFNFNANDQCYLYSATGCSFNNSCQGSVIICTTPGSLDYYASWGIKGDDSVTVIVCNGTGTFLYRVKGGVAALRTSSTIRVNTVLTNSTIKFGARSGLFLKGRFYFCYFYNRPLTTSEMILFSP